MTMGLTGIPPTDEYLTSGMKTSPHLTGLPPTDENKPHLTLQAYLQPMKTSPHLTGIPPTDDYGTYRALRQ